MTRANFSPNLSKILHVIGMVLGGAFLTIGLYLAKSALGIDIFDGPSFLHAYFFKS